MNNPRNDKYRHQILRVIVYAVFAFFAITAGYLQLIEGNSYIDKAENNYIIRGWIDCGLIVKHAADSQALVHLKKEYCDRRDCLRCRIGYEYLKKEYGAQE